MREMPSPLKWDEIPEPPELDFSMPDDPFRADLFAGDGFDYRAEDDSFKPFIPSASDEASAPTPGAPTYNTDAGWSWHDAGIIAVERAASERDSVRYSIGAIDLYANAHTGDLGGSYLEIGLQSDQLRFRSQLLVRVKRGLRRFSYGLRYEHERKRRRTVTVP